MLGRVNFTELLLATAKSSPQLKPLQQLCPISFFKIDFRERGKEKETLICFSTYLCIHWLILVCALTGDQTHNLGILGMMV